ncbi:MAG: DUF6678 family protein [Gemmataceae bacterium]
MAPAKRSLQRAEQTRREMAERERRIDSIIRTKFATSCMSNSKWRRAFDALDAIRGSAIGCRWKFVDSDRIQESNLPSENSVEDEGFIEDMYGIILLKHVEWFEVSTTEPEAAETALAERGQFAVERVADGIRLFGYR